MYSGTGVWAGHAHWQSTTLWKYAGFAVVVGCKRASSRGSTRRVAPGRVESTPAATSMLLRGFHYAAQGRPDSGTFVRQGQALRLAAAREPPGRECEPVGRLAEQLALPLVPAVLAQERVLRGRVHRASHAGQPQPAREVSHSEQHRLHGGVLFQVAHERGIDHDLIAHELAQVGDRGGT